MVKHKLFKRALPLILSIAMVFQSMPATAMAAEYEETEIVTEQAAEAAASENDNQSADDTQEKASENEDEAKTSAEETEALSVETEAVEKNTAAEADESETGAAEYLEQAEELQEAALDTRLVLKDNGTRTYLETYARSYGLTYQDGVISSEYDEENSAVFDSFVNNRLKDDDYKGRIFAVEIDGEENKELVNSLTFKWQKKNGEAWADMTNGDTPSAAGSYQLVVSLEAVDGLCKAAETAIAFEIEKAKLSIDLSEVERPEIGSTVGDFKKAVTEAYILRDKNDNELNKDAYVESVAVKVKDALTGAEITDGEAKLEKGKTYSYAVEAALKSDISANYEVKAQDMQDITAQGDIETEMEVTLPKTLAYTYNGKKLALPKAGEDYTVKVTYTDEETGETVEIKEPAITAAWLDADGNELAAETEGEEAGPVDAGVYTVRLTYKDETGRYAECENSDIKVTINPVSVYVKLSSAQTSFAEGLTAADIANKMDYTIELTNSADTPYEGDEQDFWGVSYNNPDKTQKYEPVFELQVSEPVLDTDGNVKKDADGKDIYTEYESADRLEKGDKKYRIVFSGKKAVYTGSGYEYITDVNDHGTNSSELNYTVDVTAKTIAANAIEITVADALTIDVSQYADAERTKIYDEAPFYEARADYKKASVAGGNGSLTYQWYKGTVTVTTDEDGKEQKEYEWNENPTYTFNYTDSDGNALFYVSPVAAGVYKLEITYNDPKGETAANPAELIYTIERQKVAAEISTGSEAAGFTTYDINIWEFLDRIKTDMAKTVKVADQNDLTKLGAELEWLYDDGEEEEADYDLAWFVERQNALDGTWTIVDKDSDFIADVKYRVSVGVNPYNDNYQGRDENPAEDSAYYDYDGYYVSNAIDIEVKKLGTVELRAEIDEASVTKTKLYDAAPLAKPTVVVKDVNGNIVTDAEVTCEWYDETDDAFVGEAVNGGTYQFHVYFEGNEKYAPFEEWFEGFEITAREISVTPVLNEEIKAGTSTNSYSSIVPYVNGSYYGFEVTGDVLEAQKADFEYGTWTDEDGEVYSGYKAVEGIGRGVVRLADGSDVPDSVLRSGVQYYTQFVNSNNYSTVYLRAPYDRNYKVTSAKSELFTPVRDSAYVLKTSSYGITATSLKDYVDSAADDAGVLTYTHTIVPREGIAFVQNLVLETLSGNFFVFKIQAPKEFYAYGSRYNSTIDSLKPVCDEAAVEAAGGYVLSCGTDGIIVAFQADNREGKEAPSFKVRWADGYTETFEVDFTGAVLEADLTKAVAPKSIAFNSPVTKMAVGEKQQLDVKVTKSKLDDIICLKYVSSDTSILSVSESGAVVALKAGSASVSVVPCYLDKDGNKQEIAGAKAATAKITISDVTASKVSKINALDTIADVIYATPVDGYRRELYVLEGNLKEESFTSAISELKNGSWKKAGFAIAPRYVTNEEYTDSTEKNVYVRLSGLKANTQYTVYVRNVSGERTLADGSKVTLSAKGTVKSFKTTLSQIQRIDLSFDNEKYWKEEYKDACIGEVYDEYVVDISEKKISAVTKGIFKEAAQNDKADANDWIKHMLPLNKDLTGTYAQPKLTYFIAYKDYLSDEQNDYYTTKIGNYYYAPSALAKADNKGGITLNGVGTVYLGAYDAITQEFCFVKLNITASASALTAAKKSLSIRVGELVDIGDYITYTNSGKQKLTGYPTDNLEIKVTGDEDAFIVNGNYLTAKEGKKTITVTVTDKTIEGSNAEIKITSKDIEAVKSLKVTDITDEYATVSFTYPASCFDPEKDTFEEGDTSETESNKQLYFRIQVVDGSKNIVSDEYYNFYNYEDYDVDDDEAYYDEVSDYRTYDSKKKTYTFTTFIDGLTRKSSYTVNVTAAYLDKASKPAGKSFKTTDIPAAYQKEYGGYFYSSILEPKFYKNEDGGIGINVNGNAELSYYPTLTSNNTYTLEAWPQDGNEEAKTRLSDTLTWKSSNTKVASVKANAGSYTAILKTVRKGTTQIELTSKLTKKVIARWTVFVNAVGEAQYYYGDFEPDQYKTPTDGIEYGDIELLTLDNPVRALLASGEGKIAKFVAPAYGNYTFTSENCGMFVYNTDGKSMKYSRSYSESLRKGETRYFVVRNTDGDSKNIAITASGTVYGTLTMDGYSGKGGMFVFTAPEDNYYTILDEDGKLYKTIGGLKAGEEAIVSLSAGTYTISKRDCTSITKDGLKEQTIAAETTNWYVFVAEEDMAYTVSASDTNASVSVYDNITSSNSTGSQIINAEKGKKYYIAVKNNTSEDIKTDITLKARAEVGNISETQTAVTELTLEEAYEEAYVKYTIPADGWYRFKATGTAGDETPTVTLYQTTGIYSSRAAGSSLIETKLQKDAVIYISVYSDQDNTTVKLAVTKIMASALNEGDNDVTLSSDGEWYQFSAPALGKYTFSAAITARAEGETTPNAYVDLYDDINTGYKGTTQLELKTGEVVYVKAYTDAEDGKTDTAKLTVKKLEAELFTADKTIELADGETKWLQFKADADAFYSFAMETKAKTEGESVSVTAWKYNELGGTYTGTFTEGTVSYKAGQGFFLKVTAQGALSYTIKVTKIVPENVPNDEVTIAKASEKWFVYTAPATGRYKAEFIKANADADVIINRYNSIDSGARTFENECILDAGKKIYYRVRNNDAENDQKVTLKVSPIMPTELTEAESSKTASLTNDGFEWYSFTAPAAGRYSFTAKASVEEGKFADTDVSYYTDITSEDVLYVDAPENAVFLKNAETLYIRAALYTDADKADVTTTVKKIDTADISASVETPSEKTETGLAADSVCWYSLKGEGTYKISFSDITEDGYYTVWYAYNNENYFDYAGDELELALGAEDSCTIAVTAETDQLGYKLTTTKLDIKELSLTAPVTASLKTGEDLYVGFKAPEDGRYAVYLEGLKDGVEPDTELISGAYADISNCNYVTFVTQINETAVFKINVTSEEDVSLTVKAEAITDSSVNDITQTGSAEINVTTTPAGYVSWYAYKPAKTGRYIIKSSDASAYVYYYTALNDSWYDSSNGLTDTILTGNETYYFAVYYDEKPEANVTFSITKAQAQELTLNGNGEGSITVDVSKTAANEKTWLSFTAPEDGRYVFSYETEGTYTPGAYCYPDGIDDSYYYSSSYSNNYEKGLKKGASFVFSTYYTGEETENYTIKVKKLEVMSVTAGQETEITLAAGEIKYVAATASKSCKASLTISSEDSNGQYTGTTLSDLTQTNGYYNTIYGSTTRSFDIALGQTKYIGLKNAGDTGSITIKVTYTEGDAFDTITAGTSTSVAANTTVSFTAEEEGIYSFSRSSSSGYMCVYVDAEQKYVSTSAVVCYLAEGDIALITNYSNDADVAISKMEVQELTTTERTLTVDDDGYAYVKITAPDAGAYWIGGNYSVYSLNKYTSAFSTETVYRTTALELEAGETVICTISFGIGTEPTAFLMLARIVEEANAAFRNCLVEVAQNQQYCFNFTAPSDGTYEFYSSTYDDTYCDAYAVLYSDDGTWLTDDDEGGGNGNFLISYELEKGQTVQLRTRNYYWNAGKYYVSIEKAAN